MKIIADEQSLAHAPRFYLADGTPRPCPECPARFHALVDALAEVPEFEIVTPDSDPWQAIGGIHDAGFLEYLRTIYPLWAAEFGEIDLLPDTMVPPHRRGKLTRPTKPSAQAGYYAFDLAAPICAATWQAALASAACAVSAADSLRAGAKSVYALCRPPGHHAGRDYHGGFCYLNNAAIAAEQLRLSGASRVAILDVDYHHGNGTQDIFYDRHDVLFASLHADPHTQYPYFWGHASETGEGSGEGLTMNFPLPRGTGEPEWFLTLAQALMHVQLYQPDALVVSLGVDTAIDDGVGDFGLTPPSFLQLGQMLASLRLPTLFIQEGGYNLKQIGDCVRNTLLGFSAA